MKRILQSAAGVAKAAAKAAIRKSIVGKGAHKPSSKARQGYPPGKT